MTAYSKVERNLSPARVVVLAPSAFADEWPQKPATEVAIGLRLISQRDIDLARRNAEREAVGFRGEIEGHEIRHDPETVVDVFNDSFMALAVARGTCDPNDISRPYWPYAEEQVSQALTPEGVRRLWDELVILHKGSGIARRAASDDDVSRLCGILAEQEPIVLDDESRKLIAYLLEKFGDEGDLDDEEEPEVVYTAKAAG